MKKKRFPTEQIVAVLKQAEMGWLVWTSFGRARVKSRGPLPRHRRS